MTRHSYLFIVWEITQITKLKAVSQKDNNGVYNFCNLVKCFVEKCELQQSNAKRLNSQLWKLNYNFQKEMLLSL